MSAPIYTASPLREKSTQSLAFLERGIKGLNTGKLDDVFTVGLPHIVQPLFPEYAGNLSSFLAATMVQKRVTCGTFKNLSTKRANMIPLALPPLVLSPLEPFKNEDERSAFLAEIPEEKETSLLFRKEIVLIRQPTLLSMGGYPDSQASLVCSVDTTNLDGMAEYVKTVQILSLFLATHSYPAFQTEKASDKDQIFPLDMEFAYMEDETAPCDGHRGRAGQYSQIEDVYDSKTAFECVEETVNNRLQGDHGYTGAGKVNVAKPAPLYSSINYGRAQQVPNLPGFLLPYFKGMMFPSKSILVNIVRRYFPNCFGDNYEDNVDGFAQWVRGVNSWYRSERGIELTHIFYCLQTAMESQARLFVVLNDRNEYQGCAILGFRFSIWANGFLREKATATELRSQCMQLDAHTQALDTITNILKEIDIQDEIMDRDVGPMLCTRDVFREINLRSQAIDTVLESLTKAVGELSFVEKYHTIDIDKITKMMSLLTAETFDSELVASWPMYLEPTLIYNRSKFHQVLSAYGPTAPSFLDVGGVSYQIPKGPEAADPLSEIDPETKKPKLEKVYVTAKKIFIAIKDMQNVFDKRAIRQNTMERSGVYRTICFVGKSRNLVWDMLKNIPFAAEAEKGKGKRGIDEVSAAEGADSGKRVKAKARAPRKKLIVE